MIPLTNLNTSIVKPRFNRMQAVIKKQEPTTLLHTLKADTLTFTGNDKGKAKEEDPEVSDDEAFSDGPENVILTQAATGAAVFLGTVLALKLTLLFPPAAPLWGTIPNGLSNLSKKKEAEIAQANEENTRRLARNQDRARRRKDLEEKKKNAK